MTSQSESESHLTDIVQDVQAKPENILSSESQAPRCSKRLKIDNDEDTVEKSQSEILKLTPELEKGSFADIIKNKPETHLSDKNIQRPVKKLRVDNNRRKDESSHDEYVEQAASGVDMQAGSSDSKSAVSGDGLNILTESNQSGQAVAVSTDIYKGFQHCLIEFYERFHNAVPVSPLMEDVLVSLDEFYVRPPMVAVDLQHPFCNPEEIKSKTPITSYKQLLFSENGEKYKDIYVTADAGMGKTLLCKYLCMTWCRAHDQKIAIDSMSDNVRALREFEFLFYIPLRDVDRKLCSLDDFVDEFSKESLTVSYEVRKILDERICLIIIDGLDEWNHPETCTKAKDVSNIPHRKYRKNCTVVTTTRPWKFDFLRLPSNLIDRHIEISKLDKKMSHKLVENAIDLLNRKASTSKQKSIDDFYQTSSVTVFKKIRDIPYIYLQGMCLWFDDIDMGSSKCEIFTNILELTLNRGAKKIVESLLHVPSNANVPKCLKGKILCIKHLNLLINIGKLAFYALFEKKDSPMLVFDDKFALRYLSDKELEYCLKAGLLSQNKCYRFVSKRISNVSFQHKTLQEYFAALFMQSEQAFGEQLTELVAQSCSSFSNIMGMSEVFIFLSGFSPASYSCLSRTLTDYVKEDIMKTKFRSAIEDFREIMEYYVMYKFQKMQVQCAMEMEMNGETYQNLPLEDVLINTKSKDKKSLNVIYKIVPTNGENIKSISITGCERIEVSQILETFQEQYLHSMEKIELWADVSQQSMERLMTQSANSLQCLVYRNLGYNTQKGYFNKMTELSASCLDTFLKLNNLQSLWLGGFILTHDQLEIVNAFISGSKVTRIYYTDITCSSHGGSCNGAVLDLSRLQGLLVLGLVKLPVSELYVNKIHLQECKIGSLCISVTKNWLRSLPDAPDLFRLRCFNFVDDEISSLLKVYPTLFQLKRLEIYKTNLGDNILAPSSNMKEFQKLYLYFVSLTSTAFREMTDIVSKLAYSVTIMLVECTVKPDEEFKMIKKEIRQSENFQVVFDDINPSGCNVFKFHTVEQRR